MPDIELFSGRIVAVWLKEPARGGMLESVCVRQLGQRTFSWANSLTMDQKTLV